MASMYKYTSHTSTREWTGNMHTVEQKQNTHIQFSKPQHTSNRLLAFVVVLCHISLKKVSCSFNLKKLLLGLLKDLNLLLEKAASCEGYPP